MPKRSTTEDALSKIHSIREAPEQFDLKRDLIPFLKHRSNHVIAAAAGVIKQNELTGFIPDLIGAFIDLFPKGSERDQGCKALIAIAEALVNAGEDAAEVYEKGIHYVQMEGSFGPPIDVASPLRGLCARGMVRMRHPDALYEVVSLLVDKREAARLGAVNALADSGSRESELLLRLKVLTGDSDGDVLSGCFTSLLTIAPGRSLNFISKYLLDGKETEVEAAAFALGEARVEAALPLLEKAWQKHRIHAIRRTILFSIGVLRDPRGVEFLFTRLENDVEPGVLDALEALALYRGDDAIRARAQAVVQRRELAGLSRVFAQTWRAQDHPP